MNNKTSSASIIKALGCIIFDIAIILGFYRAFGLFFIIAPDKSALMLLFLLLGLALLNAVIIFPRPFFKVLGAPYSISIIILTVFYVLISNTLSILFIGGALVGYLVWQLILIAAYLVIFALILFFVGKVEEDNIRDEKEQRDKTLIKLYLMNIEAALGEKENGEEASRILTLFKSLKERINASTPFGRITNNFAVLDLEEKIKRNLISIEEILKIDLNEDNLLELEKLLESTKNLVINRESLNIK
ncbi:MAG: hypothetical protein EWM50_01250 [Gottschalkiaceae bacterium]|nr:MAG: hypothetical protein EWM50_01250 [Gottschalkiaceae bacterium]